MIKASIACSNNAYIKKKTFQQALEVDGVTPLAVVSEIHLTLPRARKHLPLAALVVKDLE